MKKITFTFLCSLCIFFSAHSQKFRYFDKDNAPTDSSNCYYFIHGTIGSEGFDTIRSFYCKTKYLKSQETFYRGRLEGISYFYYINRKLKEKVAFKEGRRVGTASLFHENGKPKETRVYYPKEQNEKRPSGYRIREAWDSTGVSTVKDYNGYLLDKMEVGKVKDGLKDSIWTIFNEEGEKIATDKYMDGTFVEGERTNGIHYKELEVGAAPKKGLEDYYRFLSRTLRYPANARRYGREGKVFIRFVIEVDGSLSHIEIVRGFDPECDNEALRVVKLSDKWKPGYLRGIPVRQSYTLPIAFKLAR